MVGSKSAYIVLEDLPTRISKNNPPKDELIKYFICLCAGNADGNGSIADKLNLAPMRGEVFLSWLYEAKLISEYGKPTEYGMQELRNLEECYVLGLLGDGMYEELNYFLGLKSNGNSAFHKELDNTTAAIIPETHDEQIITSPLHGYVEKTEPSEDILNVGDEPSGVELLETEFTSKNVHNKMETYELSILNEISNGTTGNDKIAKNVGIKPGYVSYLLNQLKRYGCIEGDGKKRKITEKGSKDLGSGKIDISGIQFKTVELIGGENITESSSKGADLQSVNPEVPKQEPQILSISPAVTEKSSNKVEKLKYAVLEQINRGVGNETIAKKVDISPAYVSTIVHALKKEGCVEGNGKHRHITSVGIEMLNPHKAEGADATATIEPVRQVSEVKSPAETEPVQTRELKKPFPSFSYRGRAGKNPFGQKQVDKYIGKRWYANMPKSEGMYAKSKEKIEPPSEEMPNSETFIESPVELPKETGETVIPLNVEGIIELNTDSGPIEYDERDLQILKFFLGIEKGLNEEELKILLAGDGGLYLLESRIRKKGFFTKSNGVYSLPKAGSDELDFLKEEYGEVFSEYLEAINYLRENKKMPPKIEIEPVTSAEAGNSNGPEGEQQEPQELLSASIPAPMQRQEDAIPQPEAEKTLEERIPVEEKMPEIPVLLLYAAPEESPKKNTVHTHEIKPEISAHTPVEKVLAETSPVAPSPSFLTITEENIGEHAKNVGLLKKGQRYILPSKDNPRTLVASGRFQQIGLDYLEMLKGTSNGISAPLSAEMKFLGWLKSDNGNTVITEKGNNAELVLEWLKEHYKGSA